MVYRIAQNFGKVNFWRLVARHAISGENLANPAQLVFTSLTFKNLAGKILIGLDKSSTTKILHYTVVICKKLITFLEIFVHKKFNPQLVFVNTKNIYLLM